MASYTEASLGELRVPQYAEESPVSQKCHAVYELFGFEAFSLRIEGRIFTIALERDNFNNMNAVGAYGVLLHALEQGKLPDVYLKPKMISIPKYITAGEGILDTYEALKIPYAIIVGADGQDYICDAMSLADSAAGIRAKDCCPPSGLRTCYSFSEGFKIKFLDVCTDPEGNQNYLHETLLRFFRANYVWMGAHGEERILVLDGLGKTAAERYEAYTRARG